MEYHQDRFDDYSLMVFKNEKLVGLFPANRVGDVIHSHQGLSYGGLVISNTIRFEDYLVAFKELLLFLNTNEIETVIFKILPKIYHLFPSDEIDYVLFMLDAKMFRRDISSCLKIGSENFSKDRLNGIKRGEKNNLYVKEVDCFKDFWNSILTPNLSAKHNVLPVHTLDEITYLKESFPLNIRQFNVYYNEEIVAGTTVFETTNVAHSQYMSGNSDKNTLGSLDFLHEHLIKNIFNNKAYFDFGISTENQGQNINKGLLYWKEGFGARSITHDFYEIKTRNHYKLKTLFK